MRALTTLRLFVPGSMNLPSYNSFQNSMPFTYASSWYGYSPVVKTTP